MHAICEIIIPPTDYVEASVKQIMESFKDEDEHAEWWDFFVIGGRFSGHKLQAGLDPVQLERFHNILKERKVTVSGLQCGKQELSPATQIPMVDELWREMFPGKGEQCILFAHSNDQYGRHGIYDHDICTVADIPENLACERLIVAGPCRDDGSICPKRMLVTELWNGTEHQKTQFDGNVKAALDAITKADDWRKCEVGSDWLCVTVDYHN